MKLIAFAWRTTPLTLVCITAILVAALVLQATGEGHWIGTGLLGVVHVVFWNGTAMHRRTLERLQQRNDQDMAAFADHMMKTHPFGRRSLDRTQLEDVQRWRKLNRP